MSEETPHRGRDVLTQAEAAARAGRVSGARYELALEIDRDTTAYRGDATVSFDLRGEGDLFLDFRGRSIERLEVNGTAVDPARADCRVHLPASLLAARNRVRVVYENDHDTTGDGFSRFVDPEDGETYLFTDLEPFSAHRLFPCFDQPDIKATYRLEVTAPEGWEVIANAPLARTRPAAPGGGRATRVFEESARFSTYVFALVAGPYAASREEHRGVPLGVFCRRSLRRFLDVEEIFTLTRQGLDFFPAFFDYPYPFKKYDQAFVPELNAGAMENVAAVTHSERMIFRDPPTEHQRLSRAEVILHEMAHMWFGNLVTMRWWNDLWLNESFATYMSYVALHEATRFKPSAWKAFHGIKSWAYRQDQLVTTHPVAGEVEDTEHTFLNFDGITYGKGASAMQQLAASIGQGAFREGTRRFFRRHEYGNATLRELLAALEEGVRAAGAGGAGAPRDLAAWSRAWLERPSLNTIEADWQAEGGRISRLRLLQRAPREHPTLRPHRVDVALGREEGGAIVVEAIPVHVDGPETDVPAARGRPAPDLVFPNHNDLTFAKSALDPASLAYVRAHLERVGDPLLRQLLGAALWSMVRDRQLASIDYLALLREKLPLEPDLELCEGAIGNAVLCLARYVPEGAREAEASAICALAVRALERADTPDARLIWARALVGAAYSAPDLQLAARLADGAQRIEGLELDQELRWTVAVKWIARGMPGAEERLAEERRRDPSDRGQRAALRAETARPDPGVKAAAWERFHGGGYGSLQLTAAAMSGFGWPYQRELLEPYAGRFFERVAGVFEERTHELASAYFNHLFPSYRVEPGVLARSEALAASLAAPPPRLPVLLRHLREANDELARAIACRELAARSA